jgi:hypothetical protein
MFGTGCDIYFPRFFHNPPVNETINGNGVLVNHFYTGSDIIYSAPLKAVEIDQEGILRLKWWKKNDQLKDLKFALTEGPVRNSASRVHLFNESFNTSQVGVVEADFILTPDQDEKSPSGFYFDAGKDSGYFILFNRKETLFGTMKSDGSDRKITVTINRDLVFPEHSVARLVFKDDMMEAYLNEYLVMLKRMPWSGKLGIISNTEEVNHIRAWKHN